MQTRTAIGCAAATLCLVSHAVAAQDIVKQADDQGRVTITDNPDPARRTLQRYAPGGTALIIVQKPAPQQGGPAPALNAPWPMQPRFEHAYDEVQYALDTMKPMSSPRTAAIDAREAARRAHARAPLNPLKFHDVQFKAPSLKRYAGERPAAQPRKAVAAALPALNWAAGGELGVALLATWTSACLLLWPAARRRLGLCLSAVRAGIEGWLTLVSRAS